MQVLDSCKPLFLPEWFSAGFNHHVAEFNPTTMALSVWASRFSAKFFPGNKTPNLWCSGKTLEIQQNVVYPAWLGAGLTLVDRIVANCK